MEITQITADTGNDLRCTACVPDIPVKRLGSFTEVLGK